MRRQQLRWILMVAVVILVGAAVVAWPFAQTNKDGTLALVEPSFIKQAFAEGEATGASIVEQEAGIAAYFKADATIDLSLARDAFRTIETEGADYLIGSVAVPGHDENDDVHVYLHKDGWFLAYYLKADATAKFVDFPQMTSPTVVTAFQTVLALVADAAGTAAQTLTYYDFRYPNANQILFVYEDSGGGNHFQIKLPSDYVYFERSVRGRANMVLNGVGIDGAIPATSLAPDIFHDFSVDCCPDGRMVLVLTYRVE